MDAEERALLKVAEACWVWFRVLFRSAVNVAKGLFWLAAAMSPSREPDERRAYARRGVGLLWPGLPVLVMFAAFAILTSPSGGSAPTPAVGIGPAVDNSATGAGTVPTSDPGGDVPGGPTAFTVTSTNEAAVNTPTASPDGVTGPGITGISTSIVVTTTVSTPGRTPTSTPQSTPTTTVSTPGPTPTPPPLSPPQLHSPPSQSTFVVGQKVTLTWITTGSSSLVSIQAPDGTWKVGQPTSGTAYTFTPTAAGSYNWYVRAVSNGVTSAPSAQWQFTMNPDTAPPSTPVILTLTGGGTPTAPTATITWRASTDNVGVVGYNVFRNGLQIASTSGGALAYTDTNPGDPAADPAYQVQAFDAAGNLSQISVRFCNTGPGCP